MKFTDDIKIGLLAPNEACLSGFYAQLTDPLKSISQEAGYV
ncbi:hypothetical protein [Aquiflexum sp.]